MKIAPEGKIFIIISLIISLLLYSRNKFFSFIGFLITGFLTYFFRDPERETVIDENRIYSPADGTIINIEEVEEDVFIKGPVVKISIFMSLTNVHVNRVPTSGSVALVKHIDGKFLPAWNKNASFENERNLVGLETIHGKILITQIAGLVARRIVCRVNEGDMLEQGEKLGLIKFSSRVEIFLPKSNKLKINVNVMDKVQAGLTSLAEYIK